MSLYIGPAFCSRGRRLLFFSFIHTPSHLRFLMESPPHSLPHSSSRTNPSPSMDCYTVSYRVSLSPERLFQTVLHTSVRIIFRHGLDCTVLYSRTVGPAYYLYIKLTFLSRSLKACPLTLFNVLILPNAIAV